MKRATFFVLIACGIFLTGLVATQVEAIEILTKEDLVEEVVVREDIIKTADNGIILFDTSDSMNKKYLDTGMSRYEVAKKMLMERNQYFPDVGHNMGLYSYGPWKAYYPVQPYNREKFAAAVESLPDRPRGPTNLQWALQQLDSVLKDVSGMTVVFVITDGTFTDIGEASPSSPRGEARPGKRPGVIAKELAEKYDVCFGVISTADDKASRAVTKAVGEVGPCSRTIPFERFVENPQYNSGMLFTVKSTVDVVTKTETKVMGAKVDDIAFGYDKSAIGPASEDTLDKLGSFLKNHPDTFAVIAGYTCSLGSDKYNLALSRSRAEAVAQYLVNRFGIDSERLVTQWYGKLNPVGDNSTEEGRAMNRRVEIAVGGMEDM
jgi:OOP family OmpA-OmpF porin